MNIIERCKTECSYSLLIRTLGEVFSCAKALSLSFVKTEKSNSPLAALLDRAPDTLLRPPADLNKEAVRSLQGEDKEEDSSDPSPTVPNNDDTSVDLPSVRRAYEALWSLPGVEICNFVDLTHSLASLRCIRLRNAKFLFFLYYKWRKITLKYTQRTCCRLCYMLSDYNGENQNECFNFIQVTYSNQLWSMR